MEVRNETGGSGVVGATYAYEQPADGYTFLLGTQSLYIQDLLGKMDFDFRDAFDCETVLVHSINLLSGSRVRMEKYGIKTFSDLRDYAAEHPGEVSVALQSATGVDGMCLEIATEGLALNPVPYNSGDEANSDMAEGSVDLSVGGYDDMYSLIESGDVVPLLLFCEHRVAILPECECTAELNIESYAGPWRAIFAKKGTPPGGHRRHRGGRGGLPRGRGLAGISPGGRLRPARGALPRRGDPGLLPARIQGAPGLPAEPGRPGEGLR